MFMILTMFSMNILEFGGIMDKLLIVAAKLYNDPTGGGGTVVKNLIDTFIDNFKIDLVLYRTPTHDFYKHKNLKTYFHPILYRHDDKFERRILNYKYNFDYLINQYDLSAYKKIIIIHTSKMFGLENLDMDILSKTVLFPMYLSPSYKRSNECVPLKYTELEQKVLNAAFKIVTPSESEKNDLINFYNIDSKKVEVINRGVNEVFFSQPKEQFNDPLKLIVVSTIKEQKNVIESVQILKSLRDYSLKAHLTIIGKVESPNLYEDLKFFVKKNDLLDSTTLIQGVDQNELALEMKKSDILILPSLWETFGRVVYEGLSSGLPTIIREGIDCFSNLYKEDFIFPYATIDQAVFSILELCKKVRRFNILSEKAINYASQFSSLIEQKKLREVILWKG